MVISKVSLMPKCITPVPLLKNDHFPGRDEIGKSVMQVPRGHRWGGFSGGFFADLTAPIWGALPIKAATGRGPERTPWTRCSSWAAFCLRGRDRHRHGRAGFKGGSG